MGGYNTNITNRSGWENSIPSGTWPSGYGGNITSLIKPFSTQLSVSGSPHYQNNILLSTGIQSPSFAARVFGSSASGLNPFGVNTLGENIISGSGGMPGHLNLYIDPNSVRAFGFKNPFTLVGWGFDVFGYPAPNFGTAWAANGAFGASGPSDNFIVTSVTGSVHGRNVPFNQWLAGPLDLRWEPHRKIWTPPQSTYSAHVLRTYSGGSLLTPGTTGYYFPEVITYDVQVFDGPANTFTVTGITPVAGPRPQSGTYKVKPLTSGNFCFVVHTIVNSKPGYGIFLVEPPGVDECLSSSTTASEALSYLTSTVLSLDDLLISPLEDEYGGTNFGSYTQGQILQANASGNLVRRTLGAGSGINMVTSGNDGGSITISLSTGIAFTSGGVNTSITALLGLTTPISVSGGGTGTNYKSFIDTYSDQVASGVKTWMNGIKIGAYGSSSSPSIAFYPDTGCGLFLSSGIGLGITSSGGSVIQMCSTGIFASSPFIIYGNAPSGYNNFNTAPLIVKEFAANNVDGQYIQIWNRYNNLQVAAINPSGAIILGPTGARNILMPCATGGYVNYMPSNSGTLALVSQITGYNGNIPLAHPSGGGQIRTLQVSSGLITGYVDS